MSQVFSGCAVRAIGQGWEPRSQEGDHEFRYVLRERWREGPLIGWVGMNPSDADDKRTDPTWMRWRGFAERWGFGGQIVVNPVPRRSSSPEAAIQWLNGIAQGVSDKSPLSINREHVRRVASECTAWVIGWGDKGAAMDEAYRVHRDFLDALRGGAIGVPFLAFGLTKGRNPKHVLARGTSRIPDDAPVFEIEPIRRKLSATAFHISQADDAVQKGGV